MKHIPLLYLRGVLDEIDAEAFEIHPLEWLALALFERMPS